MSEEGYRKAAYRRKHVQRMKKFIVGLFAVLVLAPNVCCGVLFVRVHNLNRTLENLSNQLEELEQVSSEQQKQLQEWMEQADGQVQEAEDGGRVSVSQSDSTEGKEQAIEDVIEQTADQPEPAHKVYLTFDDGPSIYTDEILDILNEYGVKATFFVVGKEDERSKAALQRIVEEGHTLGMHSYSHEYSQVYQSVDDFSEDFTRLQNYLYEVTGVKSIFYRFPGGSSNTVSSIDMQEFADYLDTQGVTFYDWNISSGDGGSKELPTDVLVYNSTNDIPIWKTAVVLMHDSAGKRTTVDALPEIIENILALEDTVILPITEDTQPVQHIHKGQ